MFTGIIEGVGKVEKITQNTKNRSAFQMTVDLGKHARGLKVGPKCCLKWSMSICHKNFKK